MAMTIEELTEKLEAEIAARKLLERRLNTQNSSVSNVENRLNGKINVVSSKIDAYVKSTESLTQAESNARSNGDEVLSSNIETNTRAIQQETEARIAADDALERLVALADAERLSKLFQTIYFCNKAVIMDVHGACIGGANGIIAAADIVIAEKETKFAFSEVRLGITPATISPFVVSKIGNTAAKELMLTGRRFTAEEAKDFRLVNVVVDESEMIDTERQYIDHFLHASPDAIAECKNLLRMVSGTDDRYSPVFMQTSVAIANQRISKSGQEGMAAFFEKRKPSWDKFFQN